MPAAYPLCLCALAACLPIQSPPDDVGVAVPQDAPPPAAQEETPLIAYEEAPAAAQEPAAPEQESEIGFFYASSVDLLGDLDGDGCSEIIVGSPREEEGVGRVHIYSGKTGEELRVIEGESNFGWNVTRAGDLNRDGFPDFVVGTKGAYTKPTGRVMAISGNDGSILFEVHREDHEAEFGSDVASIGDVDSDGIPDLLIRTRLAGFVLLSGRDGSRLREFDLPYTEDRYYKVTELASALGDVDGDGTPDFALSSNAHENMGRVEVRSGRTGALIHSFANQVGDERSTRFGERVAGIGDVNGDGHADYALKEAWWDSGGPGGRPLEGWIGGETTVVSGKTGERLYGVQDPNLEAGYESVVSVGDIDGDEAPDWVGAEWGLMYWSIALVSGRTGNLIRFAEGDDSFFDEMLRKILVRGDDVDGDGVADFLMHTYSYSVYGCWGFRVYSGRTGEVLHQKHRTSEFGQGDDW